ncbi:MAG: DUF294 nucleotidyltransferase-like domain-containing protein [Pseudomonadota bacterium]|nr:DUF294 nucleotidyltransferase-like domain-containing protein [Pseudomonadota bacterium]
MSFDRNRLNTHRARPKPTQRGKRPIMHNPDPHQIEQAANEPTGSRTAAFCEIVRDHMDRAPVAVPPEASTAGVVDAMRESGGSSVVVLGTDGAPAGILTERDVVRRLAFQDVAAEPVAGFMSSPVHTIQESDYLFHAIASMRRLNLRHMPVLDATGRLSGLLHLHRALADASCPLMQQIDVLTHEATMEGLAKVKNAQVDVAHALLEEQVPARDIQRLLTQINNDIYRRIVGMQITAMKEEGLGEPPVRFAVIVMGSGGRGESFLFPDQDNGFVLEDYPDSMHPRVDRYFIELAERMTTGLDEVGISLCRGYVMATNPLWRKSLDQWFMQLRHWMAAANPNILRLTDVFFDFTPVAGDRKLAAALRDRLTRMARGNYGFLRETQRAQEGHGVALGLFGRLSPDHSPGPWKGKLNLKYHGLLPLVEAARLLALREGIADTSTPARLGQLRREGVLDANEYDYLNGAFQLITELVLRLQLADLKSGRQVGAWIATDDLTRRDKDMLRDGLLAIQRFKSRVRMDLTGDLF